MNQGESHAAFLDRLQLDLMRERDPAVMVRRALRELALHLEVNHAVWGIYTPDGSEVTIQEEFLNDRPQVLGTHRAEDYADAGTREAMMAGKGIAVDDVITDERTAAGAEAFRRTDVRAFACEPLVTDQGLAALIAITSRQPRPWRRDEVHLLRDLAARLFPAVERARTEQALRDSEARYRDLFESMDEGFCVIEVIFDDASKAVDYRFLEVNPSFEAQTGIKDAPGKTIREIAPALEEHWFEFYGRVALTGVAARCENRAEQLGRWYEVHALRQGAPEDRQVAVLFNDITARKQAEEQLMRANRRLSFLSEAASGLLAAEDPVAFLALLFRRLSELLEVEACVYFVEEDKTRLRLVLHHGIAEEAVEEFRLLAVGQGICGKAAAEQRPIILGELQSRSDKMTAIARGLGFDAYACLPLVALGRLLGTLSFGTARRSRFGDDEIALFTSLADEVAMAVARHRAEAEQLRQRALLRSLIDLLPDFIYVKDRDSRFLVANDACARYMGAASPDEVVGHDDTEFYPAEVAAQFRADELRTMHGKPVIDKEETITGSDGVVRIVLTTKIPLRGPDGEVIGLVGTGRDISERKRAEERVRQLNEELEVRVLERTAELEAANRELEAFSYSVSHDLRAPLRAVDGFSELLLEDHGPDLNEEARDYLRRVRAASQRMGQLIDAMLQLARVTRGEMHREPVDLSALARSIAAELQESAPDRAVEWIIAPGQEARGDPRLLRALLENLLGNAWKYTGKHARPRIEFGATSGRDGSREWFVRDNGVGFEMEYASHLFAPFRRLHTEREFEGVGIGLATVQRIVARHGGTIRADAVPGQGAAFYFTLAPGNPAEIHSVNH
jgi:PAS domain S-box-containing protein